MGDVINVSVKETVLSRMIPRLWGEEDGAVIKGYENVMEFIVGLSSYSEKNLRKFAENLCFVSRS